MHVTHDTHIYNLLSCSNPFPPYSRDGPATRPQGHSALQWSLYLSTQALSCQPTGALSLQPGSPWPFSPAPRAASRALLLNSAPQPGRPVPSISGFRKLETPSPRASSEMTKSAPGWFSARAPGAQSEDTILPQSEQARERAPLRERRGLDRY